MVFWHGHELEYGSAQVTPGLTQERGLEAINGTPQPPTDVLTQVTGLEPINSTTESPLQFTTKTSVL